LKRSIQINGVNGLCITKLDVLDGIEKIGLCIGYELNGTFKDVLPRGSEAVAQCVPVYEYFEGWTQSTVGIKVWEQLPPQAQAYLKRVEELVQTPIDMVSTGPDRDETILLRHPFKKN
jgi:adenylosuccinate synthase